MSQFKFLGTSALGISPLEGAPPIAHWTLVILPSRPLRAIVEDGLRHVLSERAAAQAYTLPDASVGDPNGADPLEALTWQDLREEIYG